MKARQWFEVADAEHVVALPRLAHGRRRLARVEVTRVEHGGVGHAAEPLREALVHRVGVGTRQVVATAALEAKASAGETRERLATPVGGTGGDRLAGPAVAHQVDEVHHRARQGVVAGEVAPGQQWAEVEAVVAAHADLIDPMTATNAPG